MADPNKPDARDVVQCEYCGRDVVWLPGAHGNWVLVNAEPTTADFRSPFAGELKYVHMQHELHFCQTRPSDV